MVDDADWFDQHDVEHSRTLLRNFLGHSKTPGTAALELGCGQGRVSTKVLHEVYQVVDAIEGSAVLLRQANRKLQALGRKDGFDESWCSDLTTFDFSRLKDKKYNCVWV